MKKNDYILLYIMVILILLSKAIPNHDEIETIGASDHVLIMKASEIKPLPLANGGKIRDIEITFSRNGIVKIEDKNIKAVKPGHTVITEVNPFNQKIIMTIDIFVVNPPKLQTKTSIAVGEKTEVLFENEVGANYEDFLWESSNPDVASIDSDYKIQGNKNGSAVITLSYKNDPTITASVSITVTKPKSDTIDRLVSIAMAEQGTKEGYNNDTEYGEWYGINNQEWCAIFVSWAANKAGIDTDIIPKFASVSVGKKFFENRGQFYYKGSYIPKKGDIIFFMNGISHTGIVTKTENGRVYVIEGNSKDMVALRNYSLSDGTITGYGTPDYE